MPILEVKLELEAEENPLSISFWNLKNIELSGKKNEVRGYTQGGPRKTPDLYTQGGFGTFEAHSFFGEASFFDAKKVLNITCHVEILARELSFEYLLPKGKGTLRLKDGEVTYYEMKLVADKKSQKVELSGSSEESNQTLTASSSEGSTTNTEEKST